MIQLWKAVDTFEQEVEQDKAILLLIYNPNSNEVGTLC